MSRTARSTLAVSHPRAALPCPAWTRHGKRGVLSLLAVLLLATAAQAHPVPREFYDRNILVRLTPTGVVVDYSLQVDDWTIFRDVAALDREELARVTSAGQVYDLFLRKYGPILADNLIARLDGKDLAFRCVKQSHQVLDHVRCDFVFRADWQLKPDFLHTFSFREGNYLVERGRIDLSLGSDFVLLEREAPSAELKKRFELDLQPGDADKLRQLRARFEAWLDAEPGPPPREEGVEPAPDDVAQASAPPAHDEAPAAPAKHATRLGDLLFESDRGLFILLLLAGFLGAAHALTPGHGKTMVAAYLVGQHGTVWHALLLGVVTTLTHTGAVLALAGLFLFVPSETLTRDLQVLLGFVSGLLVTGLGFWLLMRRLARQPDHFHIGGHHHHHHHDHGHHHHDHDHDRSHADHYHDEHGHAHPVANYPGVWGLIVLGVSGGIVPCWDAIALFVRGVFLNQPWLTLVLLLAFSAGLAAVLVLIGILVVTVKGFAESRFGEGKLSRLLSLASAVFILLMGIWLCHDSLHGRHDDAPPGVSGRP